ncbi:hypothetical protein SAMN04490207_5221 [Pseudomonas gessardii]|nr:hypothetical protein SAMN04490207_5221 [Pseudomonas gessardii]
MGRLDREGSRRKQCESLSELTYLFKGKFVEGSAIKMFLTFLELHQLSDLQLS